MRGLGVDDPRGHWVAAHFDATDPADQVRHYAAARVAAPTEALYQASLAIACQQPVQPTLPECDSVDRLADWATRDADNGTPMLLLAAKAVRARQRRVRHRLPRAGGGAAAFRRLLVARLARFLGLRDGTAGAGRARGQGGGRGRIRGGAAAGGAVGTRRDVRRCVEAATARRAACAKAGSALSERGATYAAREAGATVAERNAADASGSRARPRGAHDARHRAGALRRGRAAMAGRCAIGGRGRPRSRRGRVGPQRARAGRRRRSRRLPAARQRLARARGTAPRRGACYADFTVEGASRHPAILHRPASSFCIW